MHHALADCRAALDDLDACEDGDLDEDTSDGIRFLLRQIESLLPMGTPVEQAAPDVVVMN